MMTTVVVVVAAAAVMMMMMMMLTMILMLHSHKLKPTRCTVCRAISLSSINLLHVSAHLGQY
jgi:hypothetical protein